MEPIEESDAYKSLGDWQNGTCLYFVPNGDALILSRAGQVARWFHELAWEGCPDDPVRVIAESFDDFVEKYIVDLRDGGQWEWSKGEPPKDNPAYYLRFCKSFARMGGTMNYIQLDNVAFLLHLLHKLAH